MAERIDIIVPEDRVADNEARVARIQAARRFEPVDRVPVFAQDNQWYVLAQRGVTPGEYVAGPRENLRQQLLNRKWRTEHLHDDQPIPTKHVHLSPDLGCLRGTEFDMKVVWPNDQPPKCEHPLTEPEQIDTLTVPDPAGGVNRIRIEWYKQMLACADDFDVRLNGERLDIRVHIGQQGGPIPAAYALAGTNLLLWLAMEPERSQRLFDIVTESHINGIRFFDELCGRPLEHGTGMGCDIGEMLSPDMYRQYVVPAYERVWQAYPGHRSLHMCGDINHLLDVLRDDLRIDEINGFGFPVDPLRMADAWAGRIVMKGGPSPMIVRDGPIERIIDECQRYIDTLNTNGGYILALGGGAAVGTPPEYLNAMVTASEQAARTMTA